MPIEIFGKASDLLWKRDEIGLGITDELSELIGGAVELAVDNVVPGQPIRVRWRVVLGLAGTDSTSFSIRLLVDGQPVHERKGVPAEQATVGGGVLAFIGDENFQFETVVIGDPSLARIVYRVGGKKLSAEVRGEGRAEPEFLGSIRFRVVHEPVDSAWWEWRVPAFESIEWKAGYTLVGDFVNRSQFASIALLNAELSEVRSEENPQIDPCEYLPVQVQSRNLIAAGGRASFAFGLLHDWHWLIPAAYVITGPINKTFAYAVFFHFTDEFGNVYDGRCSTRRVRHVGVSKEKRLAAVAAQSAVANAAFWAATMLGWPIAAGWYGTAAFFGEIAKDPPAPDLGFREPVDVVSLPLPRWSTDGSTTSFHATTTLLETAAYLAALEKARTVSRARMLGARLSGDEAALKQQQDGYLKIEEKMIETSGKLGEILPAVQEEVDKEPRLHSENVAPLLRGMAREGLPEATRRAMLEGGLSLIEINSMVALSRDREIVELACANGLFLTPFVVSLRRFVQEIQGDREMVLAGESYVHVPSQVARTAKESMPDVEAIWRPRRGQCCQVQ